MGEGRKKESEWYRILRVFIGGNSAHVVGGAGISQLYVTQVTS